MIIIALGWAASKPEYASLTEVAAAPGTSHKVSSTLSGNQTPEREGIGKEEGQAGSWRDRGQTPEQNVQHKFIEV